MLEEGDGVGGEGVGVVGCWACCWRVGGAAVAAVVEGDDAVGGGEEGGDLETPVVRVAAEAVEEEERLAGAFVGVEEGDI